MRKYLALLLLCLPACQDEGQAEARGKRGWRSRSRAVTTPAPSVPAGHSGSRSPALQEQALVVIEEVTRPRLRDAGMSGQDFLAVKVRVENRNKKMRLHVSPDRFVLQSGMERFPPRRSDRVEPILPSEYVGFGESITGWLTFEFPPGTSGFRLKANLTVPPTAIPVAE